MIESTRHVVEACAVPPDSLLGDYARNGRGYTDCYYIDIGAAVTRADFVCAFYSTWLFKIERALLWLFLRTSSNECEVRRLADDLTDTFAAWRVEARTASELLMCDYCGRTRSWFMVSALNGGGAPPTRLYFGSAVVPAANRKIRGTQLGLVFHVFLGVHKRYSRALLRAARSHLVTLQGQA